MLRNSEFQFSKESGLTFKGTELKSQTSTLSALTKKKNLELEIGSPFSQNRLEKEMCFNDEIPNVLPPASSRIKFKNEEEKVAATIRPLKSLTKPLSEIPPQPAIQGSIRLRGCRISSNEEHGL